MIVDTGGGFGTIFVAGDSYGTIAAGSISRVINNDVLVMLDASGMAFATGIRCFGNSSLVVNNRISEAERGITMAATVKYRDNLRPLSRPRTQAERRSAPTTDAPGLTR